MEARREPTFDEGAHEAERFFAGLFAALGFALVAWAAIGWAILVAHRLIT